MKNRVWRAELKHSSGYIEVYAEIDFAQPYRIKIGDKYVDGADTLHGAKIKAALWYKNHGDPIYKSWKWRELNLHPPRQGRSTR